MKQFRRGKMNKGVPVNGSSVVFGKKKVFYFYFYFISFRAWMYKTQYIARAQERVKEIVDSIPLQTMA